MKKILKYLEWLPFAIALGSLVIYLVYTIQLKINPAIIVTDSLISTLKTYLIIALVSLFIGLLIILIKKIYKLMNPQINTVQKETVVITNPNTEKVVIQEPKEERVIVKTEEKIINTNEPIIEIKKPKETIVIEKPQEEKVIIQEPKKETVIVQTEEKIVNNYNYKLDAVLCPECNNKISKKAAICPHCGILFDEEILKIIKKYDKRDYVYYKEKKKRSISIANIILTILFIILIFLICNMLYNKYNENIKNVYNTVTRK